MGPALLALFLACHPASANPRQNQPSDFAARQQAYVPPQAALPQQVNLSGLPDTPNAALAAAAGAPAPRQPATAASVDLRPRRGAPGLEQARPMALVQAKGVCGEIAAQLKDMERELGRGDPVLAQVRSVARRALGRVQGHIRRGESAPDVALRLHSSDPEAPITQRPLRIGVYPVAANPFHWGPLLNGLRVMAQFKLDTVVFVLQGDDSRKPNMTAAALRHEMGQAVLGLFNPLLRYSSIGRDNDFHGEVNFFRLLALNPGQAIEAFYLVGGDHWGLRDKAGGPDTLSKLNRNKRNGKLGHDPALHHVHVVFIERHGEKIPVNSRLHALPNVPFTASSTAVRNGHRVLMPWEVLHWVREHAPGLYGIRDVIQWRL